jgi:adenylate cyclase
MTDRRLAAILVADVVGYSKLVGSDETGTLAQLHALRAGIIELQIAKHAGRLFKSVGDGFLIEFSSAVQAVSCAKAIQDANAAGRLSLRIGIHLGDVVVQGDDLMGDGVNVAARIEGVAEPRGIALSRAVHEQVRDKLDLTFIDKGEIELKNIARPVQVFVVASALSPEPAPALALPDKPSIAVLPFQNMSGDPEQEYFTDGTSEDIITELSRFRGLFVIARNSSFTYKGKAVHIKQVGRELGVRYVLEGSIRRTANRVRVTAQLIDATTGSHVWAERYDRVIDDIFAVQEEVTRAIVAAIAPEINATERARSARRAPESLGAYELALRAWAHALECFDKASTEIFERAISEADAALKIDPNSVLALHALCLAHSLGAYRNIATVASHQLAMDAITRAVELDAANPLGYALRGHWVFTAQKLDRHADGLIDVRRAHDMNSNDTSIMYFLGNLEASAGDPDRAIALGKDILRLNPRGGRSYAIYIMMAFACVAARRYEEGVEWASRARHDVPQMIQPYTNLINCLVGAGRIDEARVTFTTATKIAPDWMQRQAGWNNYS